MTLQTRDSTRLIATLARYLPRGDLYRLVEPVDLVQADDPDTTIATIEKFPVKVGGL
ncbi:hypothetical protein GCM10020367_67960 [Streptomyces sannanensis]|uniref:Uncharacterized protein n=1 Tax=Streptomyces sannanensis TaxID=285536 RepID=A0ABP6S3D5_9ACTN